MPRVEIMAMLETESLRSESNEFDFDVNDYQDHEYDESFDELDF